MAEEDLLLEARDVVKSFGLNLVLKGVTLTVRKGEVLSLIGGNGAGKSTLMKIIMGIYTADKGSLSICGQRLEGAITPSRAMKAGVYMVPQEPMIFPHMTVSDNVLMGFRGNKADLKKRLSEVYKEIGCTIDLSRLGMTLSIAEQQMVELLRGLMRQSRVLILDEPTSSLTFDEVQTLFKIIGDLKSKGIGIIYITHRMAEVFEISDTIGIMADGRITLNGPVSDFTREMLVNALLPETKKKEARERTPIEKKIRKAMPLIEFDHFSGYGFKDISFKVLEGEIVGIAGVVGAGRTEFATAVFGREKPLGGRVLLDGTDITGLPTKEVIRLGINYVPEDRHLNGLFGISPVASNITSALLNSKLTGKGGFLNQASENSIADRYIEDFRIKVTSRFQEAGSLSGGNQQKVVLARALATMPKVVILDEPTRGIDAAARGDVYGIIYKLREQGIAVILISSDIDEIIELSDRAVVFCQGRISAQFPRSKINQENLTAASFGVYKEDNHAA